MGNAVSRATLVIGGGGFIGAQLVPLLLGSGRCVTVLGRSPAPRHALPEGTAYIAGDFATTLLIRPLLAAHQEVIHLAYATVPNTSYDNPLGDLLENLPPTVQLFALAAEFGLRLVHLSSGGTVYGEAAVLPITEDHATHPISPYGVTKLTLEKYAHLYAVTRDLDVVCVRPANAYGEGQRPFTGQGFIATAMASVFRNEPVRIFGARGAMRDYIHVQDIASGILAALDRGEAGSVYNLGSGIGRSNLEVVKAMAPLLQEAGYTVRTTHEPERPFDVRANVLDSGRLTGHTGWQPVVGFEDGLSRTRDWLAGHHHG
jgi:UDP-glucose 4-epimerase